MRYLVALLLVASVLASCSPRYMPKKPYHPRLDPVPTVQVQKTPAQADTTYWTPHERIAPGISTPVLHENIVALAGEIAVAWAERDTAFTVDACCWVIGGRPPYRQHIILGPYVDVIASRVLRPGEYQGEVLVRPMTGVLKATGIAAAAWYDTAPDMLGWRRCPDVQGICRYYGTGEWMEFLHLGEYPLHAAPPDFKWVVTIRRRDRDG